MAGEVRAEQRRYQLDQHQCQNASGRLERPAGGWYSPCRRVPGPSSSRSRTMGSFGFRGDDSGSETCGIGRGPSRAGRACLSTRARWAAVSCPTCRRRARKRPEHHLAANRSAARWAAALLLSARSRLHRRSGIPRSIWAVQAVPLDLSKPRGTDARRS